MGESFSLMPVASLREQARRDLARANELTRRYGLELSDAQIERVAQGRFDALEETGRVEFGRGILPELIEVFCDSPYLFQAEYEEALTALLGAFYRLKNETDDRIADRTLLEAMRRYFDGPCGGSVEELCEAEADALFDAEAEADEYDENDEYENDDGDE